MSKELKFKSKVKWGVYRNPENTFNTERYVVEGVSDLRRLLKVMPELDIIKTTLGNLISRGEIILVTDVNPLSGFPTYCTESDENSTHPSSFIRC